MKNEWEKDFYAEQYEMMKTINVKKDESLGSTLLEQAGRVPSRVLELGSGDGSLSRVLSESVKSVTAVELVTDMVEYSKGFNIPNVHYINDDFYTVSFNHSFDLILYIDGFGIGSDDDQLKLLKKIKYWMDADGTVLIDIYHPDYWRKTAGRKMQLSKNIIREYGFDKDESVMRDSWWYTGREEEAVSQHLKCYTADEIYYLCNKAGLEVTGYFPGGKMDYETFTYYEVSPLSECMMYRIKAVHKK
ncbi:class I SAM-dependent methyltransferase [Corticicoccus populi]|uniref:Class I SAM-dependent methyltransferase n=1 Tax=Corticicoccus populi TaxID=1812821 RepID=A0ABW5WZ27_9STAP